MLRNEHDSQDAFQATFLVLLRRARSLWVRDSLGPWLHQVAYRVARSARTASDRRQRHERKAALMYTKRAAEERIAEDNADASQVEAMHQEIARLPARYRDALVLCDLEGHTHELAARHLGCPVGTVKSRLARGREKLRYRLVRRGVTFSVESLAANGLATAQAAPAAWIGATVGAAMLFIQSGHAAMAEEFPASAALSGEVHLAMKLTSLKVLMSCTLIAAVVSARPRWQCLDKTVSKQAVTSHEKSDGPNKAKSVPKVRSFEGVVVDGTTGKPREGIVVVVRRSAPDAPPSESRYHTDAAGKFAFCLTPEEAAREGLRLDVTVEAPGFVGVPLRHPSGENQVARLIHVQSLNAPAYFERITLFPIQEVFGKVLSPNGEPLGGVQVLAYSSPQGSRTPHRITNEIATDAEGRFRLAVATPGTAFLYLMSENFAAQYTELKAKRGDLGEFGLEAGQELKGRVRDAKGLPLGGRRIGVGIALNREISTDFWNVGVGFGRSAKTRDDGQFSVPPLPPGKYRVTVGDGDHADMSLEGLFMAKDIVLSKGTEPEVLELRPVAHVLFTFQASDGKGRPMVGLGGHLRGSLDGAEWRSEWRTGENGETIVKVPLGLEHPQVQFYTGDSVFVRRTKAGQLRRPSWLDREEALETFNADVWLGAVVRQSPMVMVRGVADNGEVPTNMEVMLVGKYMNHMSIKLDPNQFQVTRVPVDEPFVVAISADGYERSEERYEALPEGASKSVVVTLRKKTK